MYSIVLATMLTAGTATPSWCHHCHGCYGCYGCYAGYCHGGWGCHHCHGWCGGYGYCGCYCSCYSYCGCYSCYSCYSSCYCSGYYGCCCGGVIYSPQVYPVPPAPPGGAPKGEGVPAPMPKKAGEQASARVTVTVPTDARVWVDNVECPLSSSVRSFNTPALDVGTRYTYNIKAEIVRDGRTVSETQRIILVPGQETRVDFTSNGGAVATAARGVLTASR